MVCGPLLCMALSLKYKTVLVKILYFFTLFCIFCASSFILRTPQGNFNQRSKTLWVVVFLFCVFIGFVGIFFPYEVIQHLPIY